MYFNDAVWGQDGEEVTVRSERRYERLQHPFRHRPASKCFAFDGGEERMKGFGFNLLKNIFEPPQEIAFCAKEPLYLTNLVSRVVLVMLTKPKNKILKILQHFVN